MTDNDGVVGEIQLEMQDAARHLTNLARAAAYLGKPELSGMLRCVAELLEEQTNLEPWNAAPPPSAKPARSRRAARPKGLSGGEATQRA
ncbi:MAG TPA: hypothetical protein VIL69_05000 [Roseomonas sp.]|jgi:hypothetical protein